LSLVSTIRGTKLKVKTVGPRLQKQRFPKLTAMWKKGCDACKKKNVRCHRKETFHYKGRLQEVFRAGLNENTNAEIPNSIFICSNMLHQQTWKHFAKNKRHFKQWRTSGFLRLGTNSIEALPALSWQHKIKETLQSDV